MRRDALAQIRQWDPWARLALAAWLVLVLVLCGRAAVQPYKRTLYTTWDRAGGDWQAGRTLYHREWEWHQDQFRYSPVVAALLVPFHQLPIALGGVVWRLLNAAILLGGLAWWLRAAAPARLSERQVGMFFLLVAPLALGSLNNGQPNPLVIGLLLCTLAAAAHERWKTAALCVGLACALKVYPLAVGLLLAAAYPRRFAGWLLPALTLMLVLPYGLQRPGYVTEQTLLWVQRLTEDHRQDWPLHMAYRDLWLLLRVCRLDAWVSLRGYLLLQLAGAAGCALMTVAARLRGWSAREVLGVVLALGSCWMMLCGPATESCTYVLLAPALAWAILRSVSEPWLLPERWLPALAGGLLLLSVLVGLTPYTGWFHGLGEQPLAALLLALGWAGVLLRRLAAPAAAEGTEESGVPARAA
jgi:hypothetical protein